MNIGASRLFKPCCTGFGFLRGSPNPNAPEDAACKAPFGTLHPSIAPVRLDGDQYNTVPRDVEGRQLRPRKQGDRQNVVQLSVDRAQEVAMVRGRRVH